VREPGGIGDGAERERFARVRAAHDDRAVVKADRDSAGAIASRESARNLRAVDAESVQT